MQPTGNALSLAVANGLIRDGASSLPPDRSAVGFYLIRPFGAAEGKPASDHIEKTRVLARLVTFASVLRSP